MDNNFNNNYNNNNYNSGSSYSYNPTNQPTGDGTNTSWSGQVNGTASQSYNPNYQTNSQPNGQTQYGQGNAYYSQGTQPYGQNQQKKKRKEKVKKEHGKGGFGVKLAKCAAIALVFGLISGSVFAGTNQLLGTKWSNSESAKTEASLNKSSSGDTVKAANTSSKAVTDLTDVSDIADNVMPSIVAITNMSEKQVSTWYGYTASQPQESCGSGIIVSQDDQYIYVATNNHVVSGAQSITVQFSDDSTVAAEVKGTDAGSDLAVVAVPISDISADTLSTIKVATLGNSDDLSVGQAAVAIGNALGYGQSVTTGVISALNREVSVENDDGSTTTNELIQTDAAINPGNSGGALLNAKGEVIGISSVKYSDTSVEGMGYAIPINTASPIIEKLINREQVDESRSAYLGISGVDVSSAVTQTYNMPEGIYLYQVKEGSPAEQAGLQAGDIITSFDGSKVSSTTELNDAIKYCAAGDSVEVVFERQTDGQYQEQTVTVTLGQKN